MRAPEFRQHLHRSVERGYVPTERQQTAGHTTGARADIEDAPRCATGKAGGHGRELTRADPSETGRAERDLFVARRELVEEVAPPGRRSRRGGESPCGHCPAPNARAYASRVASAAAAQDQRASIVLRAPSESAVQPSAERKICTSAAATAAGSLVGTSAP